MLIKSRTYFKAAHRHVVIVRQKDLDSPTKVNDLPTQ